MNTVVLKENIQIVRNRPLPKELLAFFEYKQGNRVFLSLAEDSTVWYDDLVIGERLFADTVICPLEKSETVQAQIDTVKDVLKQRMKYLGVKENSALEQVAKTWILPAKLHLGPAVSEFLFSSTEETLHSALEPVLDTITPGALQVHFLKIELSGGKERSIVYKFLDEGFRPSLLLVKWSHDVDEHLPTAHCVGHLLCSGYASLACENGYSLYMFNEQVLYDICSMKEPSMQNPIMKTLLETASEAHRQSLNVQIDASLSTPSDFVSTSVEAVASPDQ